MLSSLAHGDIAGWSILVAGAIAFVAMPKKSAALWPILATAFLLRAAVALAGYYLVVLPDSAADAAMFYRQASDWGAGGWSAVIENFRTGAYLYPSLMSAVFQVTGPSLLVMLAINVFLGTMIVLVVYRLALALGEAEAARLAGWMTAFWPTLVLYSAVSLREVAIVLPLVIGMVFMVRWQDRKRSTDLAGAFLWLFVASLFHTGMGAALLAVGLIAALKGLRALTRLHRSVEVLRYIPIAAAAGGLAFFILTSGLGLEKIGGSLESFGIENLANAIENRAVARAKYLDGYLLTSATDLVTQAPVRIGYFLFSPFPWAVSAAFDVVGLMDGLLYAGLVFFIAVFLLTRNHRTEKRDVLAVIFVLGCILYLFAFVTSNSGTAVRHRAKLAPVLIAVAVLGIPRTRRSVRDALDPIHRHVAIAVRERTSEFN